MLTEEYNEKRSRKTKDIIGDAILERILSEASLALCL